MDGNLPVASDGIDGSFVMARRNVESNDSVAGLVEESLPYSNLNTNNFCFVIYS